MLLKIGREMYLYLAPDEGGGGGDGSQPSTSVPQQRMYTQAEWDGLQSRLAGSQGHANQIRTESEQLRSAREDAERRAAQFETEATRLRQTSEAALAEQQALAERNRAKAEQLERQNALRSLVRSIDPALVNDFDDSILRLEGLDDEQARNVVTAYRERNISRQQQAVIDNSSGTPPTPQATNVQNASLTAMELREQMMVIEPGSVEYNNLLKLLNGATKRELLGRGKRIIHHRADLGEL